MLSAPYNLHKYTEEHRTEIKKTLIIILNYSWFYLDVKG